MTVCVTCGHRAHWKEQHAGHFVQRDRKATRYDEKNVNVQCVRCNTFRSGEQFKHGEYIDRKYGKGTAAQLQALGSVRGTKISSTWLEYQIQEFKNKLKMIKNSCALI